jgi:hypothetical protein
MSVLHYFNILILVSLISTVALAQKTAKPNIVFILADDQRNADCGFQRSPSTIAMPSIDKLATIWHAHPEKASELEGKYKTWRAEMKSPMGELKNKANNNNNKKK